MRFSGLNGLGDRIKELGWLGLGSVSAITLSDLMLSRVLVRQGRPMVSPVYSPYVIGAFGLVGAYLTETTFRPLLKNFKLKDESISKIADGMLAGAGGVAVSAGIGMFTSTLMSATARAAAVTENAAPPQGTAGFGFGRAYARSVNSLAGLGNVLRATAALPGTISGATVQFEDVNGRSALAGATVQYESVNTQAMAGSLY